MEFYNLDKERIRRSAVLVGNSYVYSMGDKVEVTAIKRRNDNSLLSASLSDVGKEDKMMIRYSPSNVIYFDKELLETDLDSNLVSCCLDTSTSALHVGELGKYEINSGVLAFTGVLSANNLVQEQRKIYCNSQLSEQMVKTKTKVFALGALGDSLFGIYFMPRERGLAISEDGSEGQAYSLKNWNLKDCGNWGSFTLEDWFKSSKIQVL